MNDHLSPTANVKPVSAAHRAIAASALKLMNWFASGVAIVADDPAPRPVPPRRRLGSEYPAFPEFQARRSLARARRQHAKGNLTDDELDDVLQRCGYVEKREGEEDDA